MFDGAMGMDASLAASHAWLVTEGAFFFLAGWLKFLSGCHCVLTGCLVLLGNHCGCPFPPLPPSQWFAFTQFGK